MCYNCPETQAGGPAAPTRRHAHDTSCGLRHRRHAASRQRDGIHPGIFDEIRRLAGLGIAFCPTSGRQYTSLRKLFAPVADELYYICENGAVIFGPGNPGPVLDKVRWTARSAWSSAATFSPCPAAKYRFRLRPQLPLPQGPEIVTICATSSATTSRFSPRPRRRRSPSQGRGLQSRRRGVHPRRARRALEWTLPHRRLRRGLV